MTRCINWKVMAALAALAVGLFALAPRAAVAALPLLAVVACPVAMLAMMWAMGPMRSGRAHDGGGARSDRMARPRGQVDELDLRRGDASSDQAGGRPRP